MDKEKEFNSLEELFDAYPWRSPNKFIPLAKRYGFDNRREVMKFLSTKAIHDQKINNKDKMLPIYSPQPGEYHFDTMVCNKHYFLIFININSRKAYAYYMKDKSSNEVKAAFDKFIKDIESENKTIKMLKSDQDSAYLSKGFIQYLLPKGIPYRTTEDENHNILGIINRFMRTLRDLNEQHEFSEYRMEKLIKEYNNSPHRGLAGKTPNQFTEEDEKEYIKNKNIKTDQIKENIDLKVGDRVRIVLEKKAIGKNRTNLSNEAYIIDSKDGNSYIIKAEDGSIDKYSAYRLVKCDDRYKLAKTIKEGKRGIVEEILAYDSKNDRYKVRYDEDTIDYIPSKNLREANPLKLSQMEREYWIEQDDIPIKIRKYM